MDKEITIQDLYDEKAEMQVKMDGHPANFSVEMVYDLSHYKDELEPDCKVFSFTANKWFRTKRGADGTRYKSISDLKKGIQMSARARGLKVQEFILKLKK